MNTKHDRNERLNLRLDPELVAQLDATANRLASCPSTSALAREAMRLGLEIIEHRASGGSGDPRASTAERVDRVIRGGGGYPLANEYITRGVR
jgi:hypothetical protein